MYYERKFEFQIAVRKRAVGDQTPSACSLAAKHPPQGAIFLAVFAPRTPSQLCYGAPFTVRRSRAASHGILIVTPRLEFPATVTKQSPARISNGFAHKGSKTMNERLVFGQTKGFLCSPKTLLAESDRSGGRMRPCSRSPFGLLYYVVSLSPLSRVRTFLN